MSLSKRNLLSSTTKSELVGSLCLLDQYVSKSIHCVCKEDNVQNIDIAPDSHTSIIALKLLKCSVESGMNVSGLVKHVRCEIPLLARPLCISPVEGLDVCSVVPVNECT